MRVLGESGYIKLIDSMGDDLSIVRSARVSHDADWRAGNDKGSDARLINYLYKHGHNTPFESVEFQFEVQAPIFVLRQWMRHRTWSFNEVSARYSELPCDFYIPDMGNIGMQCERNKQASNRSGDHEERDQGARDLMAWAMEDAFQTYEMLLEDKVPRELARSVLPMATYSRMFAKVDLSNLFKFLNERCAEDAQYEIRVYADAICKLIEPIVPVAYYAWRHHKEK